VRQGWVRSGMVGLGLFRHPKGFSTYSDVVPDGPFSAAGAVCVSVLIVLLGQIFGQMRGRSGQTEGLIERRSALCGANRYRMASDHLHTAPHSRRGVKPSIS
jgi:hypothetical protein